MPTTHVKGRVLFENFIPVGHASVEVFDNDTDITLSGLVHTTDTLGFLETNENGWFEGDFDLAWGDAPRVWVKVRKDNRTFAFDPLPAGEPQLRTDWSGPQRWLRHEDPNPVARQVLAEARKQAFPVETLSRLPGATVSFGTPVARLKPVWFTQTPLDAFALPQAAPSPDYMLERNAASDVFANTASRASADTTLQTADRPSYRRIFDHLPATSGIPQTVVTKPRSVARVNDSWIPDDVFAEQRIAGVSPMVIARVGSTAQPNIPGGFDLTDAQVRAIAGWTLAQLRDANRLYVCDYSVLAPVYRDFSKSMCAGMSTVGLFFLADPPPKYMRAATTRGEMVARDLPIGTIGGGTVDTTPRPPRRPAAPNNKMRLMPLAIRVTEKGGNQFLAKPGDPNWPLAKLAMQSNDIVLHEMRFHLWNCHFAMEPVVLSLVRQLDARHPVMELLDRHTYAALWINNYGFSQLVNPGGAADTLLGLQFNGVAKTLADSQAAWSWNSTRIKADINRRGLTAGVLPNFPYRDDGIGLFDAIRAFTGEYVEIYYDNDNEVGRDDELRNWLAEMSSLGVAGLPSVTTRSGLADFLAELIFQVSAQHGAVNTPQWDVSANSLGSPAYLRTTAGVPANASADEKLTRRLPLMNDAIGMMKITGQLAVFSFEPKGLGHYRDQRPIVGGRNQERPFPDGRAEAAATRFRDALTGIENSIVNRIASGGLAYDYLQPSKLDNATHK